MPILTITEDMVDEIVATDFLGTAAKGHVERAATEAGAYSEITTYTLVAGTRLYTVRDLAGAVDSWYRIFYSKSDNSSPTTPGAPFQAGDETGGLLCSVYDVEQAVGPFGGDAAAIANARENVLEAIRQVSAAIEGYCGRWFAPRPLSGDKTYRTHTRSGRVLWIPKGIRSITTLSTAVQDQPSTGGTYTAQGATTYYIDPPDIERDASWPGTSVRFLSTSGSIFYNASYGVEIVGAFGWASVPYDIQGVAIRASVRRYIGKGGGGTAVAIGPEGTEILLPDLSGVDRRTLEFYRHQPVG